MNANDASSTPVNTGNDRASLPREAQPSNATPPDGPRELGMFMLNRYVAGDGVDASRLDKAIEATQLAVGSDPKSSGDSELLVDFGFLLGFRFRLTNKVDDLHRAIPALQSAIDLSPEKDLKRAKRLDHLAKLLRHSFFKREGVLRTALDCAVLAARCAVELTPDGHADKPAYYNNLGSSFRVRFERNGDMDDIEHSIAAHLRAVELTPEGHADKPGHYNNLGSSFRVRFERNGDMDDIEQSIAALSRAVEVTPDGHANMPLLYTNLGSSFRVRFERNGDMDDIEQSIAALSRAVEVTPDGHANMPLLYTNLGSSFRVRFERNGDVDDIKQSIAAHLRALELTPDGHADKPGRYNNLAVSLDARCRSAPTQSNFDGAVQAYMDATARTLGIPSVRLRSARRCVNLHFTHPSFATWKSLLLAYSYVIAVLPEIVWLGHDIHRRFDESAKLGELVNAAVAAAIAAGSFEQAVEWLEAGRALIWSQVLSLRTPLDELQERQPTLAKSLRDVQVQLQHTAPSSFALTHDTFDAVVSLTTNPQADRHRGLAIEYDALLKKIRACDGFEDFLRPERYSSLLRSSGESANGPIVFLNVDEARCDALAVFPAGVITLIPLPDLSLEKARRLRSLWARQLKEHGVRKREPGTQEAPNVHPNARLKLKLAANHDSHPFRHSSFIQEDDPLDYLPAHMWEWIVGPVLKALNIPNPTSCGPLPHVTWCPTGPLTQLPLHAAGLYSTSDGPRAFDLVVSSYTPSLSAFQRSHEAALKPKPVPNVLIVTQPASLGHNPIPQTKAEGNCVASILRNSEIASTLLNHEQATVSSIEGIIGQFSWVHLACHGSQQSGNATQSAFALYDGPLSLADLMRTASNGAELAFLSACQTATGDAKNPEESAHLAAGMLAVGFQGVVATMWSIMDEDAPIVVKAYYKKLLQLRKSGEVGNGQTGAAYALHEAVAQLRAKVGEKSFGRWAPFVHFGV
ncbi:hypothetical protein PENSPDRAFT_319493 [Peniophora sp. CONT]|nr:hypothetical protein PENSPDRAFT_319493 [Peniophora sp. CONT]